MLLGEGGGGGVFESRSYTGWEVIFRCCRFISDTNLDWIDPKPTSFSQRTREMKCTRWAQRKLIEGGSYFFDVGVESGELHWSRRSYSRGNTVLIALSIIFEWRQNAAFSKVAPSDSTGHSVSTSTALSKQRFRWYRPRSSLIEHTFPPVVPGETLLITKTLRCCGRWDAGTSPRLQHCAKGGLFWASMSDTECSSKVEES